MEAGESPGMERRSEAWQVETDKPLYVWRGSFLDF